MPKRSKLTHKQIAEIRSVRVPIRQLAEKYGVSENYISKLRIGLGLGKLDPIEMRFPTKYIIDPGTGCWNWKTGKGRVRMVHNGKTTSAARVAYELYIGPIPDEKFVCHTCDNIRCVNPDHLFAGSSTDNNRDMHAKGRGIRGENHHWTKLTEENVREAREMRENGLTWREIGEHFGVTLQAIHNATSGKTWAWLS